MKQRTAKMKTQKLIKHKINTILKNKNIMISAVIVIVLVFVLLGYMIYEEVRPETFKDILGKDYVDIKWNYCTSQETVEDIKRYTLERAYPGSIGNTLNAECIFYDENNNIVGSITFLGNGNYLVYENKVYKYYQNKKE